MLTTKRQEWILQMIKGPDITPVENCPGHYSPRSTIYIHSDEKIVTIRPSDKIDLSNPDSLIVHVDDRQCSVLWDRISNLEYEERADPDVEIPQPNRVARRMLHLHLRKRTV